MEDILKLAIMIVVMIVGVMVIMCIVVLPYYIFKLMQARKNFKTLENLLRNHGYSFDAEFICVSRKFDCALLLTVDQLAVVEVDIFRSDSALVEYPLVDVSSAEILLDAKAVTSPQASITQEGADAIAAAIVDSKKTPQAVLKINLGGDASLSIDIFSDKAHKKELLMGVYRATSMVNAIHYHTTGSGLHPN